MSTIKLSVEQLLELIILGINNENYESTKRLAQNYLNNLNYLNKEKPGHLEWIENE
jgi:hypothetical protein